MKAPLAQSFRGALLQHSHPHGRRRRTRHLGVSSVVVSTILGDLTSRGNFRVPSSYSGLQRDWRVREGPSGSATPLVGPVTAPTSRFRLAVFFNARDGRLGSSTSTGDSSRCRFPPPGRALQRRCRWLIGGATAWRRLELALAPSTGSRRHQWPYGPDHFSPGVEDRCDLVRYQGGRSAAATTAIVCWSGIPWLRLATRIGSPQQPQLMQPRGAARRPRYFSKYFLC